jgi:hypothetical protein
MPSQPALECAICGRVFVRPRFLWDVVEARKVKKAWEDFVRAHVRYCKGYKEVK